MTRRRDVRWWLRDWNSGLILIGEDSEAKLMISLVINKISTNSFLIKKFFSFFSLLFKIPGEK